MCGFQAGHRPLTMMEQRVASVTSDEQSPLRLRRVFGFKGRVNDTLFHPATVRVAPQQLLVYFGGDIQVGRMNLS